MPCSHENYPHSSWCEDCGSFAWSEDETQARVTPKLTRLMAYLHKRRSQVMGLGLEPMLLERVGTHTRIEGMQQAALGQQDRVLYRGQADIFAEIIRYLHAEYGMDAKHAPYVLQAWSEGTYFYYAKTEWQLSVASARTFQALTEAEAFILQNFNPGYARDSILIVPLRDAQKQA